MGAGLGGRSIPPVAGLVALAEPLRRAVRWHAKAGGGERRSGDVISVWQRSKGTHGVNATRCSKTNSQSPCVLIADNGENGGGEEGTAVTKFKQAVRGREKMNTSHNGFLAAVHVYVQVFATGTLSASGRAG